MKKYKVDIALASYNGSKFIASQIDSIISNEKKEAIFKIENIICSDDNSNDSTLEIINEIAKKSPIIKIKQNQKKGIISNFNNALENTTSNYIMLSDQDDIWLEWKIEASLGRLLELERKYGKECPILVFTDLTIVDENLNMINGSFFCHQHINPYTHNHPNMIFASNVAPGCTMIFNRELLDIAMPIPAEAAMHDWWLILVASTFGKVDHINNQSILYRQHANNQVGAKKNRKIDIFFNFRNKIDTARKNLLSASRQANIFRERFKSIPEKVKISVEFLSKFQEASIKERLSGILQKKIKKNTFIGTIGLFILSIYIKRNEK